MIDADFSSHIERMSEDIDETVEDIAYQPILFVGSGLSRRYFDGPSWRELLEEMIDRCPEIERDIDYYYQRGDKEPRIGTILSKKYYEWAWEDGKDKFSDELYDTEKYNEDVFLKHTISQYFKEITPSSLDEIDEEYQEEIRLLQEIQPHAIVTTNYDAFLEMVFPEYQRVVGEEVLRTSHQTVGEIYKIHGCVTQPHELVLTEDDYRIFSDQKKYLTAKLLTYFAEHPVLITGYGVNDKNVRRVFGDVSQIMSPGEDEVVDNIYFLQWRKPEDIAKMENFDDRRRFRTIDDGTILVNQIISDGFDWVFNSFGSGGSIEGVDLKLLRSVMANTYNIISTKAPKRDVNINYDSLKVAAQSEDAIGTLFGVSLLEDPPDINVYYRHRLSDVAEQLGYTSWHYSNQLINQIEEETGVNIKEFDNQYHIDINFNRRNPQHRYSDSAIDLLTKVKNGEDYELDIEEIDLENSPSSVIEAEAEAD